jgi:hypothetical protein
MTLFCNLLENLISVVLMTSSRNMKECNITRGLVQEGDFGTCLFLYGMSLQLYDTDAKY